jgi:excisionase family DNA binding protein
MRESRTSGSVGASGGSLAPGATRLDGAAADGEDGRSDRSLLSVRQVAKLLRVCPATVYALCNRGELPYFRILNAIRVDIQDVKLLLRRWRR